MARDPRVLRPVDNRPTAHGAHALWRTWRGCLRGQRVTRSTLRRWPRLFFIDTTPGCRRWLRNVVLIMFGSRGAQPVRASPRGEPADGPRSTRALADLAWLSSRPPRNVLHPAPLAEAFLHRHHARLPAVASERRAYYVRLPWCAAHARFAPWRSGGRPTKHALAVGLGVVVFSATGQRALPSAVGRGSSSPTLRHVGGCGFGTSQTPIGSHAARPTCASPRGEPADGPHSTRALADLAWLSSWPRRVMLHSTPLTEALLHRHRAKSAVAASKHRGHRVLSPWRAARAQLAPTRTSLRPTEHVRAGGLGVVVFAANARHAPPHAVG